jgi:hypothetical protein
MTAEIVIDVEGFMRDRARAGGDDSQPFFKGRSSIFLK